ncbi:hypothetical protein QQX98_012808 [Neonectria punicea]|uniref:Amidase domain-containing protein n=1 Tax=Neonectria punicea TaxID=979145 RepID=A0ABR1GHT4_9HYPO
MSLCLAAVSLGPETYGSIINPASRAAIVGLKPAVGVVSRYGVYPVSRLQDTVGVMAISVLDAATVLNVIAGQDMLDPITLQDPRDKHPVVRPPDYTDACASNDLSGLRIGAPRHLLSSDPVKKHHFEEALSVLSNLGATIVDNVQFSEFRQGYYENNKDEWERSFLVELRQNMKDYLADFETNPERLHSLRDVIDYTAATPGEAGVEYGVEAWKKAERFSQESPPGSSEYRASEERRRRMAQQIPELLGRAECDLIVLTGATDTTSEVGGCPCLSVPLGRYPDDQKVEKNKFGHVSTGPNNPFGILFVGRRHSDMTLLKVGHALEQATNVRKSIKPVIEPEENAEKDFKI